MIRLKKIVQEFMFGKKKLLAPGNYPAVSDVLREILGAKILSAAILNAPDRRNLLQEAARLRGVSENDLIKQVADYLDIPVFFKPRYSDIESLPIGLNLADLRIAAVLPITAAGMVVGVVCADPGVLNSMPHFYAGSNVYLSSWNSIREALNLSEQNYRDQKIQCIRQKKENEILIYKKILGCLIQQARAAQSRRLLVYLDQETLHYYYDDRAGQRWSGQVDRHVSRGLCQYLENLVAETVIRQEVIGEQEERFWVNCSLEQGGFIFTLDSDEGAKPNLMSLPAFIRRKAEQLSDSALEHEPEGQVLIIDDNPVFREVLGRFLLKRGISSKCCDGVQSALSFLNTRYGTLPDLIICDLHMPGISGMALFKILKQNPLFSGIAVLVLTSDEDPETELLILQMGVDAFVSKTKDPAILCAHVKKLIDREQAA